MIGFVSEAREAWPAQPRYGGRHQLVGFWWRLCGFPVDANAGAVPQAVKVHDPTQDAQKGIETALHLFRVGW